ncbi:hypothetical protein PV10_00618 [Exophiala mesophila]|uniref:Uncharacterized protein n=1 Tax=Exophiala mesophila TaxID=212818 RepID=A0A0D1Y7Q7_EXOME|nr:uncharacterized protein PV10_00618 [Exophiala mesophila]KIV96801.1 hypothetical protein PV10_00618 [Exophiala mesophila]
METTMADGETASQGAAFPWVLEHLLSYPGTYEIPLRTMYILNATTQNPQQSPSTPVSPTVPGNAFPRKSSSTHEDQPNVTPITAAAQLRANLLVHISRLPSQPTSLSPKLISKFVRQCFPPELDQVDFPQALTAMDYLKDLEIRRRREVVAALDKLGIDRDDITHKEKIALKYPGVLRWVMDIETKERQVEALYTQVFVGLRRWTMINELSLTPFNKANCVAMLNTLYPPVIKGVPFVQPTAQLTPQILKSQREAFFRYITSVEKVGTSVLSNLMDQHKGEDETTGWPTLRRTLENYVRMANSVIEECYEITGRDYSPTASSFNSVLEYDDDGRRKIDSAISFGSGTSSNRNSGQSHATRPSTSSSFSTGSHAQGHSRQHSRDKLLDKPLPPPKDDDNMSLPQKPAGSTLERIARELRRIKSRNNVKEEQSRPRAVSNASDAVPVDRSEQPPPPPAKDRGLRMKRSLRRMRSTTSVADSAKSRPVSRNDGQSPEQTPAFDADTMRARRQEWEAHHKSASQGTQMEFAA